MLGSTLANVNRDPKARPSPYTLDDFMPSEPMDPETDEERLAAAKARMDALFAGMGGS